MKKIYIDYGERINTAILGVVKEILSDLSESKISSNHCFYITFSTQAKGLVIPKYLTKEYPKEMTIVLQNQFWDLEVNKENFSVSLAFNKKKENLEIPYSSITKFYDPFVKFSIHLEFNSEKKRKVSKRKNTKKKEEKSIKKKTEKIVTLDDFRKKK